MHKKTAAFDFNSFYLSGVNFTNILRAAFRHADPKSAKKTVRLSSFFALLGSGRIKAARRTLVKLTPARPALNGKRGSSINKVTKEYKQALNATLRDFGPTITYFGP